MSTDRELNIFVNWLVQKDKLYGQKLNHLLFGWYKRKNLTDRMLNHFMIWLEQKEELYGQKPEPFCDLVGTAGKL